MLDLLGGIAVTAVYLTVVSFFPLLFVWRKSKSIPRSRKYILSVAIVLMNLALFLFVAQQVSLGYGTNFYRSNLQKFTEILEKETDENVFNYLQRLKSAPRLLNLPEQNKEERE